MNYLYEVIKFTDNLPIKLSIASIKKYDSHFHAESELIIVIDGSIKIEIQEKIYYLKQNDFILINSNEIHNFTATNESNLLLALQFNMEHYSLLYPKLNKMFFNCNSLLNDKSIQEKSNLIRKHIAAIILEFNQKSNGYQLTIASEIHLLLRDIIQNFECYLKSINNNISNTEIILIKIQRILEFINNNYTRKISLLEIAQKEKYSSTYLSKLVKKHLGISFYEYLQKVRMLNATNLMISSNVPLTEIAYKCGFPNYKSFYLLTKRIYGCTPEEYREENKTESHESLIDKIHLKPEDPLKLNYDKKIILKKVLNYFNNLNNET